MDEPITLIDRDVKYSNFDGVFIDNIKGAFDATEALIHEGHERIAIIAGPETSKPGRDRLRGYKKAHVRNDIFVNEELIFYGDFSLKSGYENAKKILKSELKPTAIFSCNNLMTLGVLKALRELNLKVPKDISLIGFDDIEVLEILGIEISAVSRPTFDMGRMAMEILIQQFNKSEKKKDNIVNRITLIPQLILRGSEKLVK
jgi:LacI family transcriptional regulator